jgi:hypothetical protein
VCRARILQHTWAGRLEHESLSHVTGPCRAHKKTSARVSGGLVSLGTYFFIMGVFIIGAFIMGALLIMHICLPDTLRTMPPPFMHIDDVIFLVIMVLEVLVMVAAELTLRDSAASVSKILFMAALYTLL